MSSPEALHARDVVDVESVKSAVDSGRRAALLSACALLSPDQDEPGLLSEDAEAQLWFVDDEGKGQEISVLSANQYGWLEFKRVTLDSPVLALAAVHGDSVWVCLENGTIQVYPTQLADVRTDFALDPLVSASAAYCATPAVTPRAGNSTKTGVVAILSLPPISGSLLEVLAPLERPSTGRKSTSSYVEPPPLSIDVRPEEEQKMDAIVLVLTDRLLVLSTPLIANPLLPPRLMCAVATQQIPSAAVAFATSDTRQVWTGDALGTTLAVFSFSATAEICRFAYSLTLPASSGEEGGVEILTASPDGHLVWSVRQNSPKLHAWSVSRNEMTATLDIRRVLPVSESINTIDAAIHTEHYISAIQCTSSSTSSSSAAISASFSANSLLLVGTTKGVMIVARPDTLQPLTACRPYAASILAIHCVDAALAAWLRRENAQSSSGSLSAASSSLNHQVFTEAPTKSTRLVGKMRDAFEKLAMHSSPSVGSITSQGPPTIHSVPPEAPKVYANPPPPFAMTIGRGYRNVVRRFAVAALPETDDRRTTSSAIIWNTNDWTN